MGSWAWPEGGEVSIVDVHEDKVDEDEEVDAVVGLLWHLVYGHLVDWGRELWLSLISMCDSIN